MGVWEEKSIHKIHIHMGFIKIYKYFSNIQKLEKVFKTREVPYLRMRKKIKKSTPNVDIPCFLFHSDSCPIHFTCDPFRIFNGYKFHFVCLCWSVTACVPFGIQIVLNEGSLSFSIPVGLCWFSPGPHLWSWAIAFFSAWSLGAFLSGSLLHANFSFLSWENVNQLSLSRPLVYISAQETRSLLKC